MGHHSRWTYLLSLTVILITFCCSCGEPATIPTARLSPEQETATIRLPKPRYDSDVSIEQSLLNRRSTRSYTGEPLTLQELSQLLWATQGITAARDERQAGKLPPAYDIRPGDEKRDWSSTNTPYLVPLGVLGADMVDDMLIVRVNQLPGPHFRESSSSSGIRTDPAGLSMRNRSWLQIYTRIHQG